jgi:adenylate cyclase
VVVVDIDEKSLAMMQAEAGRFPWPRAVYAELLEGLMAQKPRAVVFDILFVEPDKQHPESDKALADAVAPHSIIFFPMVRLDPAADAKGPSAKVLAPLVGLIRRPNADPAATIGLVPPMALPTSMWRGGTINFLVDDDRVGRRYALRTVVRGWEILSLPARVALDLGFPVPDADDMILAWRGRANEMPAVSFGELYRDITSGSRASRSSRRRSRT